MKETGKLRILAYGCTSSAGPQTSDFWRGLCDGIDHSKVITQSPWSQKLDFVPRLCRWKAEVASSSAFDEITNQLTLAWFQARNALSPSRQKEVKASHRLGVIYASTKGCTEDFVWTQLSNEDPLTPVLKNFLKKTELNPEISLCVSSACSSTVGAIYLADQWLKQRRADYVLILAADKIGPFVTKGFFSLRALTAKTCKPFSGDRDGLQLGEAAAAILVTNSKALNDEVGPEISIAGIGFDTEGFAVTRPSHSGDSLLKAYKQALCDQTPDLVVAHGTGTVTNDQVEDQVLRQVPGDKIPVTSTKWSIGHTLGASAAMDIIAACEVLRTGRVFQIANTKEIDGTFKSHYLHSGVATDSLKPRKILVSSLGFGGVHGAIFLRSDRP